MNQDAYDQRTEGTENPGRFRARDQDLSGGSTVLNFVGKQ